MSIDLEGATDPGDPACYPSTPGEFAARWNAMSENRRWVVFGAIQNDREQAERYRRCHGGV